MKFLSQLFEDRATNWTSKSFSQARLKLVGLYLCIIAAVILLFAYLVVLQVTDNINQSKLPPDSQIVLTAQDAQSEAAELKPEHAIVSTEYSLEDNTLLYTVTFDDSTDVEVDLLTGTARTEEQIDESTTVGLFELVTDEIDEVIWWLGLLVFSIASLGSIFVAQATLRPIAQSVRRQKQFVSDAAHELRNPLASLQTTLESYIRDEDRSLVFNQSVAEDLLTEVKRLIRTSESLLQFEHQEKRVKQVIPCDVLQSVEATKVRLHTALQAKNTHFKLTIAQTPLLIDPFDLETILYNLIHNAVKFSHTNPTIEVTWNGSELTITDNGIGIDAKHLPYIFERFYKGDTSRSFTSLSNGLGLALVHDIVTSYQGTISVVSELNKGTTFTIIF